MKLRGNVHDSNKNLQVDQAVSEPDINSRT